ncbi:MAG: S-layer homology domain-containing protein [Candidatus Peribacteraceae bacterium]|nr:S-layer homology domain-containing protein [Candidatus Peribacteraceae bacterium]MBP9850275.1 S-layer homology domain-containing protein [Candidatus Peribacteraceae bacterium]
MQLRPFAILVVPLFLVAGPAVAATFTDVSSSSYGSAIAGLAERGIVEGYVDGTFKPNAKINRAEFLKILMEARFPEKTPSDLRCFVDLDVQTPQWYARTTCAAEELGIVQGYPDGSFRPEQSVQLDEALKMALLTYGINPPATGGAWYERYLNEARLRGILVSLLSNPARTITRGEMAQIAYTLVIDYESSHNSPDANPVCGNDVVEVPEQCDDGNVQDSDGCSSICIIVPEPTRRAILQIDQQTTGTLSTVARGQKGVTLLKFNAVSGRQDSQLTSIVFEASAGSLLYGQNYMLLMDRDGDGFFETTAQASGKVEAGRLMFESLTGGGVELPEGLIVPFVVKADLASTYGPVIIGLTFATSLPDYIEAQGSADGLALEGIETNNVCSAGNCFIRVNTSGSTDISIAQSGNLFVTQDTLPVRSHILVGSTTTDTLLRLRLRAEGERIDIKTIRIDGVVSSVDALLLYRLTPGQTLNTGTMTPFAQASSGQCPDQTQTRVCANLPLSTFIIETDQEVVIAVAARMKSDQIGGKSGQVMTLTVSGNTDMLGRAFEARGVASTQELIQNNGNSSADGEIFVGVGTPVANATITGKTNDTALASIGSVVNDAASTETFIPVGFNQIGAFKITTIPHTNSQQGYEDVVIQTLTFRVTAQNVQLDPLSFKLSTRNNPDTQLPCAAAASTGNFDVTCSGIQSGAVQSRIGQGEYLSYLLSANITNGHVGQGASILTVSLPVLGTNSQTNSVQWSDQTTVFPWVDIPDTSVTSTVYRN